MRSIKLHALWLTMVLLAGGCRSAAEPAGKDLPRVTVSQPVARIVTDYEDFTGRTEAVQSVDVRARVTGYLVGLPFKEGSEVNEGELLFEIDPKPYVAQHSRDLGQVILATAQLKLAQADFERAKEVAKTPGAISQQDLDKFAAHQDVAQAQVSTAMASAEFSRLNVEYCTLRAPIAGRISRFYKTVGNLVNQDVTLLTTIVSMDPMHAYFDVDERTMLDVQKLMREGKFKPVQDGVEIPVHMSLANEQGYPHAGTIDFVNNRVDQTTGTLQVRGVFKNPKEKNARLLAPGMFIRVRVTIGEPYDALLISERAVGADQDQQFVYVVDAKDEVERRPVRLGKKHDHLRVVTDGLKAGDRIIVGGLQRVRPKMKVEPRMVDMPNAAPFVAPAEWSARPPK